MTEPPPIRGILIDDQGADDPPTVAIEVAYAGEGQVILELSDPANSWLLVLDDADASRLAGRLLGATRSDVSDPLCAPRRCSGHPLSAWPWASRRGC